MVDISKIAGKKRLWIGHQQAFDSEYYDDFVTSGTITGGDNSLTNIVWKQAKLDDDLKENFKDMNIRNITTHRIEFTNNVYTIPNLIELTISDDTWQFDTKSTNTFPTPQKRITIKVLDWKNFFRWVDLVDHVGIQIETDKTSGTIGFGFSEIYNFDETKDGSNWEYFPMTDAGNLPRSYILHFSVQTSTQIDLYCYIPKTKINDYNVTYDKSTEYDAFFESGLIKNVQFTNGVDTRTKYTLVAYNDNIERFDIVYQPTETISRHPLNSNADTINLYQLIQPTIKSIKTYSVYERNTETYSNGTKYIRIGKNVRWTLPTHLNIEYIELTSPSSGSTRSLKIKNKNIPNRYLVMNGILERIHKSSLNQGETNYHDIHVVMFGNNLQSENFPLSSFTANTNDQLYSWPSVKLKSIHYEKLQIDTCFMNLNPVSHAGFNISGSDRGNISAEIRICTNYFELTGLGYRQLFELTASPMKLTYDGKVYIVEPTIS